MGVFKFLRQNLKSEQSKQAYDRVAQTYPGYVQHMDARKDFATQVAPELPKLPEGKAWGFSYGGGKPKASVREARAALDAKVPKAVQSLEEFVRAEMASSTRH
jgi:hypothetical protein